MLRPLLLVLSSLCLVSSASSRCKSRLGMEDGSLGDPQISASSTHEPVSVGPSKGRLNNERGGGAWCPKGLVSDRLDEFIEVDLIKDYSVRGVLTQGRFANGFGQEFAEKFVIQYWREGMPGYTTYRNSSGASELDGNKNTFSVVETKLVPPVLASKVRIIPFSRHARTVCMRVELLGCRLEDLEALDENDNSSTEKEIFILEDNNDWWEGEYMGVAVGVLVTVIIMLIVVIVFIFYKNHTSIRSLEEGGQPDKVNYATMGSGGGAETLYRTRRLPPTPPTSEEHYTDSSLETQYSSPLLNCAKQPHINAKDWTGFLGGQPPVLAGHYAATDIVRTGPRHHHHLPVKQTLKQARHGGGLYAV